MDIYNAKKTEHRKVIEFYHELILKMQKYPCHPTWNIGIYPSDEYLEELTRNKQIYIGVDSGRIIAAMVLNNTPNEGYESVPWKISAKKDEVSILHLLGVLPEYWGKGYGKELLNFAVQLLKADGKKTLRLDVMEENLPARKMYEQNGFSEISTIKMYYESTGWSGFTMYEKEL